MPIYIILNGPPESGKTTQVARGLTSRLQEHELTVQDSFANPMKHFIATSLGVKYADLKKNVMLGVLQGYTPREFLIDLSEKYMKGRYGDDIFGRLLQHRVLRLDPMPAFVVIDDGGFDEEVSVLGPRHIPRPNVLVVRVERPGKSFSGDSRTYLEDPHYVLNNDGTIEELALKLDHLAAFCIEAARNR